MLILLLFIHLAPMNINITISIYKYCLARAKQRYIFNVQEIHNLESNTLSFTIFLLKKSRISSYLEL